MSSHGTEGIIILQDATTLSRSWLTEADLTNDLWLMQPSSTSEFLPFLHSGALHPAILALAFPLSFSHLGHSGGSKRFTGSWGSILTT